MKVDRIVGADKSPPLYIAPPVIFNRRKYTRPVRPQKTRPLVTAPQGLPFIENHQIIAAGFVSPSKGLPRILQPENEPILFRKTVLYIFSHEAGPSQTIKNHRILFR
jgi:hypothetical protein